MASSMQSSSILPTFSRAAKNPGNQGIYEQAMQASLKRKQESYKRQRVNTGMMGDFMDTVLAAQSAAGSTNPVGTPGGASIGSSNSAAVNLGIRNKVAAGGTGGPSTGAIPGLVNYSWRGMPLTTAKGTKKNFLGLLNDLAAQGYKVTSLGSYANRNARGSNRLSEHAYGRAIDINPAQNPMTSNANFQTNMPSNIARLARLHGLIWGGTWHSKKDPMHFSTTGY